MTERTLSFDRAAQSLDAVQRAAYRLSERFSSEVSANADTVEVTLHISDENSDSEALLADFRNEVLDQVLRERIRAETEDVRKLVLALAFSKTGLTDGRCLSSASRAAFQAQTADWELLPFRFERINGRVLLTNFVGEHLFVSAEDFDQIAEGACRSTRPWSAGYAPSTSSGEEADDLPVELLALKARTRYRRLSEFTALHIFVASLRCEHSCPYCQVSRQSSDKTRYDMSAGDGRRRRSNRLSARPSQNIKIEFQGGEPLLNFELIEEVVSRAEVAERGRRQEPRRSSSPPTWRCSTIACSISAGLTTSSSPPRSTARPTSTTRTARGPATTAGSWPPTASSESARRSASDRVSALMTTTRSSLDRVKEIIDCYVEQGLTSMFLRPLSPYGFAIKTKSFAAYDVDRWLPFYEEGLDYIIELNRPGRADGRAVRGDHPEEDAHQRRPGLRRPDLARRGSGSARIVYNYDGDVYASDEGRMLAEMGDTTFRLGNLHQDSYEEIMLSEALLGPLDESFTLSAPMCPTAPSSLTAAPIPSTTTPPPATSSAASRPRASAGATWRIFKLLLDRYEGDPSTRALFRTWAGH